MTQSFRTEDMMRGAGLLLALLLSFSFVFASASDTSGMTTGETKLDDAVNYYYNTVGSNTFVGTVGAAVIPGFSLVQSTIENTFVAQLANKDAAQNQNTELDVAQRNLSASKANVSTMLSYIVATLIVLTDAILSMVYIFLLFATIWIVFVGYIKACVLIINFIYGKTKLLRKHQ